MSTIAVQAMGSSKYVAGRNKNTKKISFFGKLNLLVISVPEQPTSPVLQELNKNNGWTRCSNLYLSATAHGNCESRADSAFVLRPVLPPLIHNLLSHCLDKILTENEMSDLQERYTWFYQQFLPGTLILNRKDSNPIKLCNSSTHHMFENFPPLYLDGLEATRAWTTQGKKVGGAVLRTGSR